MDGDDRIGRVGAGNGLSSAGDSLEAALREDACHDRRGDRAVSRALRERARAAKKVGGVGRPPGGGVERDVGKLGYLQKGLLEWFGRKYAVMAPCEFLILAPEGGSGGKRVGKA